MSEKKKITRLSDLSDKPDKPIMRRVFWIVFILEFIGVLFLSAAQSGFTRDETMKIFMEAWSDFVTGFAYSLGHITSGRYPWFDSFLSVGLIISSIFFGVVLLWNPVKFLKAVRRIMAQFIPEMGAEFDEKDRKLKQRVTICPQLNRYSEMLYKLAWQAGIKNVNFVVGDDGGIISGEIPDKAEELILKSNKSGMITFEVPGYVPTIFVNQQFLKEIEDFYKEKKKRKDKKNEVEEKAVKDLVRFLFAHELIHVREHDPVNRRWEWATGGIIWLGGLYLLFYLTIIGFTEISVVLGIIFGVLEIVWIVFFIVLMDQGYWSQCQEFRAD